MPSHSPQLAVSYLTGVARDIVCDSAWGPALGCLGAMAATVIIAVDTVIGVIAQQLIMPGLGPELSQHCTLVSVSTVAAVSAARCATPRPQSPEYPSALRSTPQLPAAVYLVNNIRNH